jgi:hypothetical protein
MKENWQLWAIVLESVVFGEKFPCYCDIFKLKLLDICGLCFIWWLFNEHTEIVLNKVAIPYLILK